MGPGDLWDNVAALSLSFRGDAKHRTRKFEIPGSSLRAAPE